MQSRTNTFEGGTHGAAITPANSGGVSGTAFNTPVLGTGAQILYDTASAAKGLLGAAIINGSAGSSYLPWNFTPGPGESASITCSTWWSYDTVPPGAFQGPILIRQATGDTNACRLQFAGNRTLELWGLSTKLGPSSVVTQPATRYWLEFVATGFGGTATYTVDLYSAAGALLSHLTGSEPTTVGVGRVQWGSKSYTSITQRFDDTVAKLGQGIAEGFPPATVQSKFIRVGDLWRPRIDRIWIGGAWT